MVINANVDATIVGPSGDVLGTANASAVTLPRSDESVTLHLRHEGFEDLAIEVVPHDDLTLVRELRVASNGTKKRPARRPEPAEPSPSKNEDEFMQLDKVRDPFKK